MRGYSTIPCVTHGKLHKMCMLQATKNVPFGVMNAPAVFQRLMQRILTKLKTSAEDFFAVYLDDIIIFSNTLQDHLNHLNAVFSCLREANQKLKPAKCKFANT